MESWGTVAAFKVLLLLFLVKFIGGQNVVLHVDSCYEVGTDMTITAEYTGSDTFSTMEWFYSEQALGNIVIITSTCTVLGSVGGGFPTPVSRISFKCPSTGLPQHNYSLTVEGVTEAELTNKKWGAKFVLNNNPVEQDEKNITMCPGSTTTSSTNTYTSSTNTTSTSSNTITPTVNASTTSTATNLQQTTAKTTCDNTCIIIIGVCLFAILLALFFACYLLRRRRNNKKKKDNSKVNNSNQSYDNDMNCSDLVMTFDTSGGNSGYGENNRL